MSGLENQARELLAKNFEKAGGAETARILRNGRSDYASLVAIAAIVEALISAPPGWKLVPVEPTAEMSQAMHNAQLEVEPDCKTSYGPSITDDAIYRSQYRAALDAAPKPEGE